MTRRLVINGRFLTQSVTGVQRVGIEFCRALDRQITAGKYNGLDVEILVPKRGEIVTKLELESIKIRRIGRLRGHAWEQLELPRASRGADLLCLGNTAPILSLLRSHPPTHVMVHDLSYKYYPAAYSRVFRLVYGVIIPIVLRYAVSVFTVSESERSAITDEYRRLSNIGRVRAIQNGADHPDLEQVPGLNERKKNLLYVGSLTKRKNAEGLIGAAIALTQSEDVTFTFVGANGPTFENVSLDIPSEVAERIVFRGQVNDSNALSDAYLTAAVFVFPSYYEASPLPPIEAMAHGCPVVASEIPSLVERCGEAAVYCDPTDINSIVEKTKALLNNPDLWQRMQSAGLSRSATYSWDKQANEIVAQIITSAD